jgi:hypothetical protein
MSYDDDNQRGGGFGDDSYGSSGRRTGGGLGQDDTIGDSSFTGGRTTGDTEYGEL